MSQELKVGDRVRVAGVERHEGQSGVVDYSGGGHCMVRIGNYSWWIPKANLTPTN